MPQLDVTTFSSQLFWLVLSFTSLYLFTLKVTVPRISKILDARRLRIEGYISKSEELRHNSDQVRQEFESILSSARNQAHENVMQMIHKVSVTTTQRKKDLNNMMVARVQSSEAHLARRKAQALDDIRNIAEGAAILAVERLINKKIDAKAVGAIMNELFSQKVA
jgi:F-type H+-transporting ATPase subunit b